MMQDTNSTTAAARAELAALEFEPLSPADLASIKTPDANEMTPHLQALRIAVVILGKSKPQLKEFLAKISNEAGHNMFDGFVATIEELERLLAIMRQAEARIFSAGAALEVDRKI
jgi:hypothetical protein